MVSRYRRIKNLIGPFPYNPTLMFLFFSACYFSRFIPVVVHQPRGIARTETVLVILLLAAIPSFLFAFLAHLIVKYRRWSDKSLLFYILEVSLGQSVLFICAPPIRHFLKVRYNFDYEAPIILTPGLFLGSLVLALVALSLMHRAERVISDRLSHANQLVARLESDREELVRIDEDIRQQTSRFLHDRVQSELMVVAIKLKSIEDKSDREVNEVVKRAISRLESTRSTDLRNLVQILAPNFEIGGLRQTLATLSEQYQNSMNTEFSISDLTEKLDSKTLLAIFRIIEQALINSLIHGPASHVKIQCITDKNGITKLSVSDDGPGTNLASTTAGTGSAVIDSWVSIVKGVKAIDTQPKHGYQLTITFPVKS